MKYLGYTAAIAYSSEINAFRGHVIDLDDRIIFEGSTVEELEREFKGAVHHYLDVCEEIGKDPERPYSGKFQVRVGSQLHRQIDAAARSRGKSINEFMTEAASRALEPA